MINTSMEDVAAKFGDDRGRIAGGMPSLAEVSKIGWVDTLRLNSDKIIVLNTSLARINIFPPLFFPQHAVPKLAGWQSEHSTTKRTTKRAEEDRARTSKPSTCDLHTNPVVSDPRRPGL